MSNEQDKRAAESGDTEQTREERIAAERADMPVENVRDRPAEHPEQDVFRPATEEERVKALQEGSTGSTGPGVTVLGYDPAPVVMPEDGPFGDERADDDGDEDDDDDDEDEDGKPRTRRARKATARKSTTAKSTDK